MITSAHLLVGTAIGKSTDNILLTIALALVSHYILDTIPHFSWPPVKNFKTNGLSEENYKDALLKSIEPLLGIMVCVIAIHFADQNHKLPMFLGAFFGWLPDILVFLEWKFHIKRPKPIRDFENAYHKHCNFLKGLPTLGITMIVALGYIYLK